MVFARVQRKRHQKILADAFVNTPNMVRVGFPEGNAEQSNIEKAIWNEFGTRRGIPERPFMRNTMRDNRKKYVRAMKTSVPKILKGETALRTVLAKLGALVQGDIQAEITALATPPNAPSTIKRKGSSNPLIDTGEMRQAVTWVIEHG